MSYQFAPPRGGGHPDRAIAELAGGQHGVVSSKQLYELGFDKHEVVERVRSGRLHRLHRAVFAVGHRALTQHGHWMAAVLACRPGAALSHGHAAALWSIRPRPPSGSIDVIIRTRAGRIRRRGLRVHRPRVLRDEETTVRDGIPVTTPERTLLDWAGVVSRRPVERAVDEAHRLRLCTSEQLVEVVTAHPGHPGAKRLKGVLARHEIGSTPTRNQLEERFLALCRDGRLPKPLVNAPLLGYEVDFLWADRRVVVEVDGFASHGTRTAFERDRDRDTTLAAQGYLVLRFTWRDVTRRADVVAGRVHRVSAPAGRISRDMARYLAPLGLVGRFGSGIPN